MWVTSCVCYCRKHLTAFIQWLHQCDSAVVPKIIHFSFLSYTLHTIQHTQLYIWLCCVWISPCASFPSSSICADNLSYEPVSSEAQEHLELRTERQDNTLKASCSSLIAHGSIPTIWNLCPYLLSFIAEAWRALDSWEKCPKSGLTWAPLASVYTCSSPQRPVFLGLKYALMIVLLHLPLYDKCNFFVSGHLLML